MKVSLTAVEVEEAFRSTFTSRRPRSLLLLERIAHSQATKQFGVKPGTIAHAVRSFILSDYL